MMSETQRVLLVEDNPADARLLQRSLAVSTFGNFEVHQVGLLSTALGLTADGNFDVILLDLTLPDSQGLDTVRQICLAFPRLPIVVLTGMDDNALAIQAVQIGAQDYLVKGQVDEQVLARAIRYAIERKRSEERLQYLATHDTLTNLPNRALFHDRLGHAIQRARRNQHGTTPKWEAAVMLLDLDNFKVVNDTLGHAQGDILLQAVAERLKSCIRKSDTVARMGGDEFTLIFENVSGENDLTTIARKIQSVFAAPFRLGEHSFEVTASIGISLYPSDGEDAETLLKHADQAMYRAKQKRNCYVLYSDQP